MRRFLRGVRLPDPRRVLASALSALLLVGLTLGWATTGHCEVKPKLTFVAFPRLSLAKFGEGTVITVRLVIQNANEALWCPEIEWEWPDGTRSSHQSDCDPFDKTTEDDRKWQSWAKRVRIPAGAYTFYVRIKQNGKTVKRLSADVEVSG